MTSKDAAVRGHRLFDVGELDEIVLHPPIQRFLARWRPGDPVVYLGPLWSRRRASQRLLGLSARFRYRRARPPSLRAADTWYFAARLKLEGGKRPAPRARVNLGEAAAPGSGSLG